MVLLSFDKSRHIIATMLALKFIMRSGCFCADKKECGIFYPIYWMKGRGGGQREGLFVLELTERGRFGSTK